MTYDTSDHSSRAQATWPAPGAQHDRDPARRTNPVAGVFVILGGLMGLAQALMPWGRGQLIADENPIGVVGALRIIRILQDAGGVSGPGAWKVPVFAATIMVAGVFGLVAVFAGSRFFAPAPRHVGQAVSATICALGLGAAGAFSGIASNWQVLEGGIIAPWLLLLAGVPTLIGAIVGFFR